MVAMDFTQSSLTISTQEGKFEKKTFLSSEPSGKFGFWIIETVCICFFTIEFILRYWSSPDRVAFIRGFMNLIDLAAIAPYYIDVGFNVYIKQESGAEFQEGDACPRKV